MGTFTIDTVVRVAAALDVRVDLLPRWRGGDLDRMLGAAHGRMHEAMSRLLVGASWVLAPEATFSVYGERGAIDVLAFHPPSGALLVIELKSQLVDIQHLLGAVDRYRRLAPRLATERGWEPASVSVWVALQDTASNHRRLASHVTVLRSAFPHDGRHVRGWLGHPVGSVSALSFLSNVRPGTVRSVRTVRSR